MRPIRLCFVITALGIGGAEHALLKLLRQLDRTRFAPSLIVLGQLDDLLPQFQAIGVEPVMLRLKPGRWPLAELGRFMAAVRQVQPEILQGWMYHGNLAASFAAARLQPAPKVCWSVRDTPDAAHAHSLFTRMVIRFSGVYLARVSRIFNVSARSAEFCARELHWPHERTEVLPNGVDTAVFCPDPVARAALRQQIGVAENIPVFGMVARWSPVKNHALFLAAFARLRQTRPDAQAVLVGKGLDAENPALSALLKKYDLAQCCHLLGAQGGVQHLYPGFDAVVLSSLSEGFPNVLVEAMSCAIPVISTDVGDARDIVGEAGFVVEQDERVMARAMSTLVDAPTREKMGLAARNRVVERYGLEAVVNRFQQQLQGLSD